MALVVVHIAQFLALAGVTALMLVRRRPFWIVATNAVCGLATVYLIAMDVQIYQTKRALERAKENSVITYGLGIIHKPPQGCPSGFREVGGVFKREGRKSPGCINVENPNGMIDYLMPGESVVITLVPEGEPVKEGGWGGRI